MRIISKYKDYYDWIVSKYGIDNNIILDRRKNFINNIRKRKEFKKFKYEIYDFYVCGDTIKLVFYDNKLLAQNKWEEHFYKVYGKNNNYPENSVFYKFFFDDKIKLKEFESPIPKNSPFPIALYNNKIKDLPTWLNVNLKYFDFQKLYNDEDLYLKIYNYLSKQKTLASESRNFKKPSESCIFEFY